MISTTKIFEHYQKNQRIYAIKLNPIDKPSSRNEPDWLSNYDDIFPKELTQLPPKCKIDQAIDIISCAQPIAKRPYKMSVLEAIELDEQLK